MDSLQVGSPLPRIVDVTGGLFNIRPFRCHLCSYAAHSRTNLKNHINIHTGERPHKCPVCSKGFAQKSNMRTHLANHIVGSSYVCPVCKKKFRDGWSVREHMTEHIIEPLKCNQCNIKFASDQGYSSHVNKCHNKST